MVSTHSQAISGRTSAGCATLPLSSCSLGSRRERTTERERAAKFTRAKSFQLKKAFIPINGKTARRRGPGQRSPPRRTLEVITTELQAEAVYQQLLTEEAERRQITERTRRLDKHAGRRPTGRGAISLYRCFKRSTHTPGPFSHG